VVSSPSVVVFAEVSDWEWGGRSILSHRNWGVFNDVLVGLGKFRVLFGKEGCGWVSELADWIFWDSVNQAVVVCWKFV
jgi:hypothetical protein